MKSGLSTAVAASTSGVVLLAFSNAGGLFPESGLCAKIGELIAGGAVVVGSAGNEAALQASDPNIDIWPARCNDPALDSILNDYSSMITGVPEVLVEKQHYIVVGASSCNSGACASDSRLAVSSFGSWIDLSAPGNAVRTTGNASNYTNGSGTSPAAAFVAGSAAVLRGCGVAATSVASTLTTGSVGADKAVSGLPNRINLYDSLASLNTNPTGVTLGGSMTIDENVNTGAGGGFTVGGLSTVDSTVCDSHSYMILPGGDAGFSIGGSNSDQLVLNAGVLNFEAKSSYSVTVRSTDFFGGTPFDQPITINVVDLNEPPSIAATARSIDENSANGTSVGTPIPASDPDATTGVLSYAITGGNTGGAFTINNSGQISVLNSAALDFETTPVFNLTVQVTDNGTPGLTDSAVVTVTLNDVAEGIGEPVVQLVSRFSNPPIPDGQKVTCLVDPETLESSATCPVVVYNGITYWAYSYIDNRVAMNIVGYDAADNIVQQTNKDGLRYIVTIDVDTDNQVITFTGQVSNTATMTYSSESLLLIP